MKVTGETFSFHHKRKRAEEARYQKYPNFQVKGLLPDRTLESKGLLPDRTLESFMLKSTDGAISIFLGITLQSLLKKLFSNYLGRIFQVKRQSKKIILLFSYSVFFICSVTGDGSLSYFNSDTTLRLIG
jgi:hypothetical protein